MFSPIKQSVKGINPNFLFNETPVYMIINFKRSRRKIPFSPETIILWCSIIAGVFSVFLITFAILYIETQERAHIDRVTTSNANGIRILLEDDIQRRITSLTEFAKLAKVASDMSDDDWALVSQTLYDTHWGYQAIGWIDNSFHIRKITPISGNEVALDFDLALTPLALSAVLKAQKSDSAVITTPVESVHGKTGLGMYVAVFSTTKTGRELEGFIGSLLLFDLYIQAVLPTYLLTEHNLTLYINDRKIYSDKDSESPLDSRWHKQTFFELQGLSWKIDLVPDNEFLVHSHYKMIKILILLGILLSLFIAIAAYMAMYSQYRAKLIKDDRKKTENLLKNLPGMAYQAFNKTNWPMILVSDGCEALTGYNKTEFEQHNILWGDLIHPEDYAQVCQTVSRAIRTKSLYELEYRILDKNNDVRLVWEKGESVTSSYHEEAILEGFVTDITSIKQIEIDLIQSHAFSDAVVNSMVEAVITTDNKGLIQSFNEAAQKMFGYAFDEVKDKNATILMPHPCSENHEQYVAEYLKTKQKHIIGIGRELTAKHKDGTIIPIHISISEIYNCDNLMFVALIRDITQQLASEEQARLHTEQLAHSHRLNSMGEMAAGIAHEINQPLTAISLFSQTAKNFCQLGKYEKLPVLFEKLSQQALRAGQVLERVQVMTRQGDKQKEVVDCKALVGEVRHLAESEARLRDINIRVGSCDYAINLFVDRVQIQQVILNLLRNGMEAMQSISCAKGAIIELQTKRVAKNNVQISVTDTGCGLSKSMTDKLFTPFSSTKKNGTGIGLSISKSIIEEHGGHIHFSENKPAGAIFYFTLPIYEEKYLDEN